MNTQAPDLKASGSLAFLIMGTIAVIAFVAWAVWGRLDVVSLADGEVVPGSRVKAIQHLEGGIVREIAVRERQQVRAGDVLLRLDSTAIDAQVEELSLRLRALEVDEIRLRSEVAGESVVYSQEVKSRSPSLTQDAQALAQARKRRLEKQTQVQASLVTQRERQIQEVRARLRGARTTRKHLQEQVDISSKLLKKAVTNRMTHLDLLRRLDEVSASIEEDTALLHRTEAGLNEAKLRREGIRDEFEETTRQALRDIQRERQELAERQRKFQDTQRRMVLTAPVDGIVKSVHISTLGGVIRPGQTVVEIVPGDDALLIDARLPVQDIGHIQAGQRVQIDLTSADAAGFESLYGLVEGISPDTLTTDEGRAYYKVRVKPDQAWFDARSGTQKYQLYPGMLLACSIITGERRVMDYLLDPFVQGARTALRER